MGRYYRLSKPITEEMAAEIVREAREVENVRKAEFLEDCSKILVVTEKENYPEVMTKLVNIFSRVGRGCEISFAGFAYQNE
ncbi:hypothetical protein QVN96_10595 [Mediterraneibacter glycyrrhizinilyticus]|uniref:hypothetical protein n=1 Tax=Mediterraneibacter glycyrrhizinilyticus TaxID=342942 RepID=UPI0025AA9069|nr:hypothetical protein [Mediterraneibacter glycyrrhizinilyticus]MDN0061844.1 hypothetical protein [Mediterraneibacter glycyrrhizinilyticus]